MEQVCLVVCDVCHRAVIGDMLLLVLLLHFFLHLLPSSLSCQCCYPVDPAKGVSGELQMSVSYLLAVVSFAFILEAAMVARGGQPSGQHLSEINNILSFSFRAYDLHVKMITG